MLVVASLPTKFCVETFIIATHIINVLPSTILKCKTPYELLLKTKPDYTKFISFECACYPVLCSNNKHKLDFCSSCCLFLGYSFITKVTFVYLLLVKLISLGMWFLMKIFFHTLTLNMVFYLIWPPIISLLYATHFNCLKFSYSFFY